MGKLTAFNVRIHVFVKLQKLIIQLNGSQIYYLQNSGHRSRLFSIMYLNNVNVYVFKVLLFKILFICYLES